MFKVVKIKTILSILFVCILMFIAVFVSYMAVNNKKVPKTTYTIIIDAGHGGRDDGCSGAQGTKESEINLAIAKTLKTYLNTLGLKVVMTREDGNGLYDAGADNFKLSDMNKRLDIIKESNADMVISNHQNSYPDKALKGAQVFYQEDDEVSCGFADSVKSQLVKQLENARSEIIKGDYFLLKESQRPAIIVECGYLSNVNEEALLNDGDYQSKVSYSIMCGVVKYFDLCGND